MKRHLRRLACVIFGTLALIGTLRATGPNPALTPLQMERYKRLTHELIAPCCWREPIAIHRSEEALQMLDEVERFVAEGRSEEEIKAIYVARYGPRILADPPGPERHWLYLAPVVLFCTFVFLAVRHLRSLMARVPPPNLPAPPELIARVRMDIDN